MALRRLCCLPTRNRSKPACNSDTISSLGEHLRSLHPRPVGLALHRGVKAVIPRGRAGHRVNGPDAGSLSSTSPQEKAINILDLPIELLELVVEASDVRVDLFNIRLTCKAFGAAAWRAFTVEYIERLSCFVLDPSRLLRIKHITSTPQLAEKVEMLNLTFDTFDNRASDNIVIAPLKDETIDQAQMIYSVERAEEEILQYQAICTQQQSINLDLVHSILGNLGTFGRCWIKLDCYDARIEQLPRHSITFPASCLRLVEQHALPLTTLDVNDRCDISLQALTRDQALDVGTQLLNFRYESNLDSLEDLTSPKAVDHLSGLQRIIANSRLLTLDIRLSAEASLWRETALISLPGMLMPSTATSTLTQLTLSGLHLPLEQLLDMLTCCSKTLEEIRLHHLVVLHEQTPWEHIWRKLKTLPKLAGVDFESLMHARPGGHFVGRELFVVQRCLGNSANIRSDTYAISTGEKWMDAKDFLEWNLDTEG